jgi:hypothetical protein
MNKLLIVGVMTAAGLAWAGPGQLDDHNASGIAEEPVRVLDVAPSCTAKAAMCFKPGAATTVQMDPVAAPKGAAPRFSRAASVAAAGKAASPESKLPWTVDVAAQLKRAALTGNTLFVFFDLSDPLAVKDNHTTALFQAPVKAGKSLGLHLSLSGEDGFRAGHTYRMRILQLVNGREVLLAESDFSLL